MPCKILLKQYNRFYALGWACKRLSMAVTYKNPSTSVKRAGSTIFPAYLVLKKELGQSVNAMKVSIHGGRQTSWADYRVQRLSPTKQSLGQISHLIEGPPSWWNPCRQESIVQEYPRILQNNVVSLRLCFTTMQPALQHLGQIFRQGKLCKNPFFQCYYTSPKLLYTFRDKFDGVFRTFFKFGVSNGWAMHVCIYLFSFARSITVRCFERIPNRTS